MDFHASRRRRRRRPPCATAARRAGRRSRRGRTRNAAREVGGEAVAEHSHRTALIAALLAMLEGADPGRAALLALFHDTQETRTGDIPSVGKAYLQEAEHTAITADQTAAFPEKVGRALLELVEEYEGRESIEAQLARDADKLECLIQAREYLVQGYSDVPPWIETSAAAVKSDSARELARLAQELPPSVWWQAFVAGVHARQGTAPTTAVITPVPIAPALDRRVLDSDPVSPTQSSGVQPT